jgi:assimilatory nitrate reductase catalytic subunit
MTDAVPPPIETHCPYCAMQCGMNVSQGPTGWTIGARDFPTNRGGLCRKGWTAAALLDSPERLLTPLMRDRKDGPLRPAGWDEALDHVATKFAAIAARSGRNAIGVFGGGGLTNEKAYMLGKFARVALRTANIDYNGRYCMASAAAAAQRAFGLDRGLPFPMTDIAETDVLMLVGANSVETLPIMMQWIEVLRRRGGATIVIDPRRSETAKLATVHLQLAPGTDGALAQGLLNVAITEGLLDRDFIAARTDGFEAVRRSAQRFWPDRVERITGVPAHDIVRAAHMMGEAAHAMLLSGRGAEQQSQGVNNVLGFINFMLALGKIGRPLSGFGTLTGQGNGQGGREHGQKADQLPGYRKLDDPAHRAFIADIWGVAAADLPQPGLSAQELLDGIGRKGGVEALMVMGSNVVVSSAAARDLPARLRELDCLVVADFFLSETAALADVVLPVTQWAEEEGTMTNLEGRILLRRRAKLPPSGVRGDGEILKDLATRMGCGDKFSTDARETFEELRRASAGGIADYAGVTYERIAAEDGVFWPCPSEDHPGTPRAFLEKFATPNGRARFHVVEPRDAGERPDQDYPYYLTTGRVLQHYQSGTQTRRVAELHAAEPEAFVEIHPQTARSLGISAGARVRVASRRGEAFLVARLNGAIRLDTLFVPFHWAGTASVNALTNAALDPISRMPEFKVCAVRIEIVVDTESTIAPEAALFVGAGAPREADDARVLDMAF